VTTNPFTTFAASDENEADDSRKDGTIRLARAVIYQAMHDLGAWCRHCHSGKCQCAPVRLEALAFLRGQSWNNHPSALAMWCQIASWPEERIRAYFSPERVMEWVPFVVGLRTPYRRARKGKGAPVEASIIELLSIYAPNRLVHISHITGVRIL
jgi:hypothetical protein